MYFHSVRYPEEHCEEEAHTSGRLMLDSSAEQRDNTALAEGDTAAMADVLNSLLFADQLREHSK